MNLANAKVGQLLIPVDDFEKGIAFYRDILGLPFLFAAPPQMAFFRCGDVRLLVGVHVSRSTADERFVGFHSAGELFIRFVLH